MFDIQFVKDVATLGAGGLLVIAVGAYFFDKVRTTKVVKEAEEKTELQHTAAMAKVEEAHKVELARLSSEHAAEIARIEAAQARERELFATELAEWKTRSAAADMRVDRLNDSFETAYRILAQARSRGVLTPPEDPE